MEQELVMSTHDQTNVQPTNSNSSSSDDAGERLGSVADETKQLLVRVESVGSRRASLWADNGMDLDVLCSLAWLRLLLQCFVKVGGFFLNSRVFRLVFLVW